MDLTPGSRAHGFTVLSAEELPEIDGDAFVLSHEKSGARLLLPSRRLPKTIPAFSISWSIPC